MSSKIELKACPFCGAEAKEVELYVENNTDLWFIVECSNCPVKTYDQSSRYEAVRVWNTRATPANTVSQCKWKKREDEYGCDVWTTQCGDATALNLIYSYCPFCGGKLVSEGTNK